MDKKVLAHVTGQRNDNGQKTTEMNVHATTGNVRGSKHMSGRTIGVHVCICMYKVVLVLIATRKEARN